MTIKCGRMELEVTSKDRILDNGACYQLITQTYYKGFCAMTPKVSNGLFKKLLKDGKIRLAKEKHTVSISHTIYEYDLYEFVE